MIRVLALVEGVDDASVRLRVKPLGLALGALGVALEVQPIGASGPVRWAQFGAARDHDVVWWQRRLPQPWECARLRAVARRLLVDLDDAVWRRPAEPHSAWWRRVRLRALLARADVITVGAAALAAELAADFPALPSVTVLPTPCLAPPFRAAASSAAPLLAWVGQPATWRYAIAARDDWEVVARAVPSARWRCVGAPAGAERAFQDGPLAGRVECVAWSETREATALDEAWVGLAPLPDDPWTRGKCAARLQSCLARGMAVWAAPVGAQAELIERYLGGESRRLALGGTAAVVAWLAAPEAARMRSAGVAAAIATERSAERLAAAWLRLALPGAAVAGRGGAR